MIRVSLSTSTILLINTPPNASNYFMTWLMHGNCESKMEGLSASRCSADGAVLCWPSPCLYSRDLTHLLGWHVPITLGWIVPGIFCLGRFLGNDFWRLTWIYGMSSNLVEIGSRHPCWVPSLRGMPARFGHSRIVSEDFKTSSIDWSCQNLRISPNECTTPGIS